MHVTDVTKPLGKVGRESGRFREPSGRRIVDDATRQRRARQAIEALDSDNFHDDPHGDLVANKNAPKFQDTLDPKESRKRKSKGADYYKFKYRKTIHQMVEYESIVRPDQATFMEVQVPPSNLPKRHFCGVCGFPSNYNCVTCGIRYCSITCLSTHRETRCLKWTA